MQIDKFSDDRECPSCICFCDELKNISMFSIVCCVIASPAGRLNMVLLEARELVENGADFGLSYLIFDHISKGNVLAYARG